MILICGSSFDPVILFLRARWDSEHLAYRLLDLECNERKSAVQVDYGEGSINGFINGGDWLLDVSELTGVFFQGIDYRSKKDANSAYAACEPEIAALLNNLPCKVANRPAAGMSNRSKPLQALHIRECGFRIPETLVTNDPAAAKRFYEEHSGKVIFKSIGGVRSIVRKLSPQYLKRLPLLRNGPTQFQALIAGDDIRVHVVADQCFATRIRCSSVDYRFAWKEGIPLEMEPTALSGEVASRCLRLTQKLGFTFAGIDLKESPMGEYYCFEANATPGFSFYERATCQPISAALGEFLGRS
jgi:glutathione synthase/RimK-type ligase-like ATP-grasp enzyme